MQSHFESLRIPYLISQKFITYLMLVLQAIGPMSDPQGALARKVVATAHNRRSSFVRDSLYNHSGLVTIIIVCSTQKSTLIDFAVISERIVVLLESLVSSIQPPHVGDACA